MHVSLLIRRRGTRPALRLPVAPPPITARRRARSETPCSHLWTAWRAVQAAAFGSSPPHWTGCAAQRRHPLICERAPHVAPRRPQIGAPEEHTAYVGTSSSDYVTSATTRLNRHGTACDRQGGRGCQCPPTAHGMARHDTARPGSTRHGATRHGTARHDTVRYGTTRSAVRVVMESL